MKNKRLKKINFLLIILLFCSFIYAQKPRARDLGVPFVGTPGTFNAITDVKGDRSKRPLGVSTGMHP